MNSTDQTDYPGESRLALLCRLLLVAISGGVVAVAVLGSSFPIAVLAALLLMCLAVCLVLLLQSRDAGGKIAGAVEDEERRRNASSYDE